MPIYEFKCINCGNKFEKIVFKPLGEVKILCPKCESEEVEKLVSAPGGVSSVKNASSSASDSCSSSNCCSTRFT